MTAVSQPKLTSIAEILERLAQEVAGQSNLRGDHPYAINEITVKKLLGEGYESLLKELEIRGYIRQGIDAVNPKVLTIELLAPSFEILQEWSRRRREARSEDERNRLNQADLDIPKLVDYFKPIKPDKEYAITPEKLNVLLEVESDSDARARLHYLTKAKYLKTDAYPHENQYEIEFLAKAVELAKEADKKVQEISPRQMTINGQKLDTRTRAIFELLSARPDDLETVARSYLWNMRSSNVKRVIRASQRELQRLVLLRGRDLSADLMGVVRLRLMGSMDVYEGGLPEDGILKGTLWKGRVGYEPWN